MDAKDLRRLRKIAALLDSPNEGERDAAAARARAMLEKHGKAMSDLPALLAGRPVVAPATPYANPLDGFADYMEAREPGYKARAAAAREAEVNAEAEYRKAVLRKYGSKRAALASAPIERAIDTAVRPFLLDTFPEQTLGGWLPGSGEPPADIAEAIRAAWPFPTTLAEAKAEDDFWIERAHERATIERGDAEVHLSLGCALRSELIEDLLHHRLRARTVADVLLRLRYMSDLGMVLETQDIEPLMADLEFLAVQEQKSVQNGHQTTAERRQRIERLLNDPKTAGLADREIARRVGVSPQTVGNIRRRIRRGK